MEVESYPSLIEFIKTTTDFTCAYELVVLFAAMKLKDADGKIDREQLAEFFLDFYRTRKATKLPMKKPCNPLEDEDLDKTIQMLNRGAIGTLLKVGILKTFVRFKDEFLTIIFRQDEELLSTLKEQIIKHFVDASGDSKKSVEAVLLEWEGRLNAIEKPAAAAVAISPEPKASKYSTGHIQNLTSFYQKMQDDDDEEGKKSKSKKGKKK